MSTVIQSGMYISLSKEDYAVIENDIELFRTNETAPDNRYKFTVNKFLNNIFVNMFDRRKFDPDSVRRTRKKDAVGFNIKPNKAIIAKTTEAGLDPESDYSADFAAYYIQFIEEYCRMTLIDRERVFYKQLIGNLMDDIELKYLLKLTKNDKWDTYIFPYAVKGSDDVHKCYITGFALRKTESGYIYKKTLCVPLNKILNYQRIEKINPEKQIFFEENSDIQSYSDMKEYIEYRFRTDGVLYLSDILRDVTVRLSDNGREMLLSRTLYRPFYQFDENDNYLIHFRATQLQTFMYFFKFGREAEILQPKKYRDFFLQKYKESYLLYSKDESGLE